MKLYSNNIMLGGGERKQYLVLNKTKNIRKAQEKNMNSIN